MQAGSMPESRCRPEEQQTNVFRLKGYLGREEKTGVAMPEYISGVSASFEPLENPERTFSLALECD